MAICLIMNLITVTSKKPGTKKCGHMGGKVLVSTQEHCDRLVAARLATDILGTNTILVARTDAEAATLLDSNIDRRDHPFILGVTNPSLPSLRDTLDLARNERPSQDLNWVSRGKIWVYHFQSCRVSFFKIQLLVNVIFGRVDEACEVNDFWRGSNHQNQQSQIE